MNHQTYGGPHPHTRIKHVDGSRVLRVEPVQGGSCAHAWHSLLSHEDVKGRQSAQEILVLGRVNPIPDALESAIFDLDIELLPSHDC